VILLDTNGHPLDIPETLRQMPNHQVGFLLSPSFVVCYVLFDLKLLIWQHNVYNNKSKKVDNTCAVPFTFLIEKCNFICFFVPNQILPWRRKSALFMHIIVYRKWMWIRLQMLPRRSPMPETLDGRISTVNQNIKRIGLTQVVRADRNQGQWIMFSLIHPERNQQAQVWGQIKARKMWINRCPSFSTLGE